MSQRDIRSEYTAHMHMAQPVRTPATPTWARPSTCRRPATKPSVLARILQALS